MQENDRTITVVQLRMWLSSLIEAEDMQHHEELSTQLTTLTTRKWGMDYQYIMSSVATLQQSEMFQCGPTVGWSPFERVLFCSEA
jgi:hypothetical protein